MSDCNDESDKKPRFDPFKSAEEDKSKVDSCQNENQSKNVDPCKTENKSKKVDPCKTEDKSKKVDPCKTEDKSKKVDPCKTENKSKKVDPCKTEDKSKKVDPCKIEDKSKKVDPCKTENKSKKVDPCKTENKSKKVESCKTEEKPKKVESCKTEDKPKKVESCKTEDKPKKVEPCKTDDKFKKVDVKTPPASDPCAQYYPKGIENIFKKKTKSTSAKVSPTISCKTPKPDGDKLTNKIKLPRGLGDLSKLPTGLINNIKDNIPEIDVKVLKNIEYGNLIRYGFCKITVWIRENCDPKKMADKGSGAPSRPMKFPYTFSAKIAQFPMGHYVKNQWIWKYYFVAFAACLPVFYSINKLSNSPGNVAKWAEIRRKEAAEHHH